MVACFTGFTHGSLVARRTLANEVVDQVDTLATILAWDADALVDVYKYR